MLSHYHIILAIVISLILYILQFQPMFIILFFLAAVFIDIDHYFLYVQRKNKLNPLGAYKYNRYEIAKELKRTGQKYVLVIFHTIEFFILLLILSLIFSVLWPIFFGCLFHELTDIVYESTIKDKKYKRAFSLIYYELKINKAKGNSVKQR